MPVSHLTTSISDLWELTLERLEGEGFTFNHLEQTPAEFLAAMLTDFTSTTYSSRTHSFTQLLEALQNELSDPDLFNETSSIGELLASIVNAEGSIPGEAGTMNFSEQSQSGFIALLEDI